MVKKKEDAVSIIYFPNECIYKQASTKYPLISYVINYSIGSLLHLKISEINFYPSNRDLRF